MKGENKLKKQFTHKLIRQINQFKDFLVEGSTLDEEMENERLKEKIKQQSEERAAQRENAEALFE